MASDTPARDQDKFVLRLPDGMRERIRAVAERHKRSMNAEIIATLEEHYPKEPSDEELIETINIISNVYFSSRTPATKIGLKLALDFIGDRLEKERRESLKDRVINELGSRSDKDTTNDQETMARLAKIVLDGLDDPFNDKLREESAPGASTSSSTPKRPSRAR